MLLRIGASAGALAGFPGIMAEHFHQNVAHRINGRAKAMIVTRSRQHCVRNHRALDRYLKEQGDDHGALVAFSGTVHDGGIDHTEAFATLLSAVVDIKGRSDSCGKMLIALAHRRARWLTGYYLPWDHSLTTGGETHDDACATFRTPSGKGHHF